MTALSRPQRSAEEAITAGSVGDASAWKPLRPFGSASVRKVVSEGRAKAEMAGLK